MSDEDSDGLRALLRGAGLYRSAGLSAILGAFALEPEREFRAVDFSKECNLRPGSVLPILDKLARAGWIEIRRVGKPKPASIKTYVLTDSGARFILRYRRVQPGVPV